MIGLYIFFGLIILSFSVFFVFQFDALFGKLDYTSNRMVLNKVVDIIKEKKLEKGTFYDLGSCRGTFSCRLSKEMPELKIYGIDDSWLRVSISKFRGLFHKNLSFTKQNLFKTDLSLADVVYIYLPQEMMRELEYKLQKELKTGVIVFTNRIFFPNWKPAKIYPVEPESQKSDKIFVYKRI